MKNLSFTLNQSGGWLSVFGKSVFLVLFAWCLAGGVHAQTALNTSNDTRASGNNCDHAGTIHGVGTYTDDGGDAPYNDFLADGGYQGPFIWTFCPDSPMDDRVRLTFSTFDIAAGDEFKVFEGTCCNAGTDEITVTGNSVGGMTFAGTNDRLAVGAGWIDATCANVTGCVSISWTPNRDNLKGQGWKFDVSTNARTATLNKPATILPKITTLTACNTTVNVPVPAPTFANGSCVPNDLGRVYWIQVLHNGVSKGYKRLADFPVMVNNVPAGYHWIEYKLFYDPNGTGNTETKPRGPAGCRAFTTAERALVLKDSHTGGYRVQDAVDLIGNDEIVVSLGDDCWTDIELDDVLERYEDLVTGPDGAGNDLLAAQYKLEIHGIGNSGAYSNNSGDVVVKVGEEGSFHYIVKDDCGNVVDGTIVVKDLQGPVCASDPIVFNRVCTSALPAASTPPFKDCSGVDETKTTSDDLTVGNCGVLTAEEVAILAGVGVTPFNSRAASTSRGGGPLTLSGSAPGNFVLNLNGFGLGFNNIELVPFIAGDAAAGTTDGLINGFTLRRWKAVDTKGNITENCPQVFVNYRPAALTAPAANVTLECGANTDPAVAGGISASAANRAPNFQIPGFDRQVVLPGTHSACNWSVDYTDQEFPTCGNGKKIVRTWSVIDWCAAAPIATTHTQVIKLEDRTEPELVQSSLPEGELEYSTEHFRCEADITLPSISWTDACSNDIVTYRTEIVRYRDVDGDGDIDKADGTAAIRGGEVLWTNNSNGGAFNKLAVGTYWAFYYAVDACGNETTQFTDQTDEDWNVDPANVHCAVVKIVDDVRPQPQCDDLINVSLGSNWGQLHVRDVDEGSYDNCGIESMGISLSADGPFTETLKLDCDIVGIHTGLEVHLQVTDKSGNTNTCWGNIQLEDKIAPVCTAPADMTVNCTDADIHYADIFTTEGVSDITGTPLMATLNEMFGTPTCVDNLTCGDLVMSQSIEVSKGDCGAFTVYRDFTAADWRPNTSASVRQQITVQYVPNWKVTFPGDTEVVCTIGGGDALPTFGEDDLVIEGGFCDQIGVEVESREFVAQDGACRKIEVTYHVINWCDYEAGQASAAVGRNAAGGAMATQADGAYVTYTRVIKLVDNVAPVVTIDDPDLCINGGENASCSGTATWTAWADDCVGEEDITFIGKVYEVSASGARTLVAESDGPEVTAAIFNKSIYVAEFWAYDGCGNSGGAETSPRAAWDCKQPTPYALNGVVISIMPTGMVAVWASDLDQGSFDNCSPQEALDLRIRKAGDGAPTSLAEVQALSTSVTFDCLELGTQTVELYVIDREGNYDFVTTYVIIQDNIGACTDIIEGGDTGQVAGTVVDANGEYVENVAVSVNGGMASSMSTEDNGRYTFTLVTGQDYTVTPEKNVNPLNGVSTFDLVLISKHILGIQQFDTPYKYIAADINKSGSITAFDMVQLRQLILNITSEFPNNTSWRFVDAAHQFGESPLADNFNEFVSINDFASDMMSLNFTAVKVGDVNGNAQPNSLVSSEVRTAGTMNLTVADRFVEAGQAVEVAFTSADMATVAGYQFTMNYAGLELTTVGEGVAKAANFNTNLRGAIATSWNGQATANDVLFTLNFTATTSGNLSDLLSVNSAVTTAEAYTATGELMNVNINFATSAAATFGLEQNTPNPFTGETVIGFTLPTAGSATLKVMDVQGKVLKSVTADYAKGYNQLSVNAKELGATGVLHYQLESADNVATKKMIIIE